MCNLANGTVAHPFGGKEQCAWISSTSFEIEQSAEYLYAHAFQNFGGMELTKESVCSFLALQGKPVVAGSATLHLCELSVPAGFQTI